MHGMKRGGLSGSYGVGGSQHKRQRQDEDEDTPGSFEEHLANLMEDEDMEYEDSPTIDGEGPQQESTYNRWDIDQICSLETGTGGGGILFCFNFHVSV